MKKKLVIETENGFVIKVLSNVKFDDVIVVDRDNQSVGMEFIHVPDEVVHYAHEDLYLTYSSNCKMDEEVMEELKNLKI